MTAILPTALASYSGTTAMQYDGRDQLTNEKSVRLGSYTNVFAYDTNSNPTTLSAMPSAGGRIIMTIWTASPASPPALPTPATPTRSVTPSTMTARPPR